MSGNTTRHMITAYNQMAAPTMFLSGMFQSPATNFYSSEEVELDIVRSDEDISIVITDLSTGYRYNSEDIYTNKSFKPPIHKEAVTINSFDLLKRTAGENPFQQPDFRANMITRIFTAAVKIERKIRRSIELQASQVLQTGTITLSDANGVALFTVDFSPKTTHFPTSSTAWGETGADVEGDLNALAEIVRNDGLSDPDQLLFGVDAFEAFIKDTSIQARYDNRRIDQGTISPMQMRGGGGSFRGVVEIGNYRYDIWTYGGRYKNPSDGVKTPFLSPEKVVVRASSGRLDATFGAIPNIGQMLGGTGNILPELPGRLSNADGGMDLFTNAWVSVDGEQLFAGVGARPLMIPTAIDTYGCLDTGL